MSQENVERIRRGHEVISKSGWGFRGRPRDRTEMLHPDVEWHDQRELPGATVHQGVEEVERHLAAAQDALEYEAMDLLEVLDADPCVVAVYRVRARGRGSGVPVERDAVYVYRFRGPKIERVDIYGTRAEALQEAAGRVRSRRCRRRTVDRRRAGGRGFQSTGRGRLRGSRQSERRDGKTPSSGPRGCPGLFRGEREEAQRVGSARSRSPGDTSTSEGRGDRRSCGRTGCSLGCASPDAARAAAWKHLETSRLAGQLGFADGRTTRRQVFLERAEALGAAGLSE